MKTFLPVKNGGTPLTRGIQRGHATRFLQTKHGRSKQTLINLALLLAFMMGVSGYGWGQSLIAGWDFQTTANGGTAAAAAPNAPTVYIANFGTGTIYLNGANGSSTWVTTTSGNELSSFSGTAINAGAGFSTVTTSPACLAILNNTANGKCIVFTFNMTGYQNLVVSYATQRTSTGFTSQTWDYSLMVRHGQV